MNAVERKKILAEAEMQLKALKKINAWKKAAIAFSTIGVAVAYAGMAGVNHHIFFGILGIIIVIVSTGCAFLLNLGLKNGRRNVEKILTIAGKKEYEI